MANRWDRSKHCVKYQQIEARIQQWLLTPAENAESLAVVFAALAALRRRDFDTEYLISLHQLMGNDWPNIVDAYCFARLHTGIMTGRIMTCHLIIGCAPLADKEVDYNNSVLCQLSYPWRAKFYPECGSGNRDDGFLEWEKPVEFGQILHTGEEKVVTIAPRQVPLEVGYTRMETTFWHIEQEGGLARWPYGSEQIYLFANTERCKI